MPLPPQIDGQLRDLFGNSHLLKSFWPRWVLIDRWLCPANHKAVTHIGRQHPGAKTVKVAISWRWRLLRCLSWTVGMTSLL